MGIDCETRDEHIKKLGPGVRRGAYIVGYSFSIEDGPKFYVPLRHAAGDNVDSPERALDYLRDQAKVFNGDLCGANMGYDLDFLAEVGIEFPNVRFFRDCQVAEPLLDELQLSYSLENIARRRGIPGKSEEALHDACRAWGIHKGNEKGDLWKLPARHVAEYAMQDAELPLTLLRRQEREIDDQELWNVYNLESKLLPVLVRMRRRGVRIDWGRLEKVERWSEQEERRCLNEVYTQTLVRIPVGDVMKAELLSHALSAIGVQVPLTSLGKKSVDKDLLARVDHPVAKLLLRARKVNKLRTTFAKQVREHAVGDRIHCTFNQLRKTDDETGDVKGARYGRCSCSDPNLQYQPARDDFAKMWRSIYIPDEGGMWACCDYSQQEPRMLTHYAELTKCRGAFEAAERYRTDPTTDNHTMMTRLIYEIPEDQEPSKKLRTNCKITYLGLCYGMGGGKLAGQYGLPTKEIWSNRRGKMIVVAGDEAQAIIDKFNNGAPFVKQLARKCEQRAKLRGFLRTLSGRRCRFPRDAEGHVMWAHKGLNRIVQGSSGDQTKAAMVAADAEGFKIQLQVHDELDQTVSCIRQARELAKIMRECLPIRVPSRVDVEVGPSWGEIREWKCDQLADQFILGIVPHKCNTCPTE